MEKSLKILAIETSCDETAVSIVEGHGVFPEAHIQTLAEKVLSQAKLHAEFGGVFPALAKREHTLAIVPLVEAVLTEADLLIRGNTDMSVHAANLEALLAHEKGLPEQIISFLSGTEKPDLDAIVVTAGPGLEPALWVGINAAKALGMVWGIPVIPQNHMEGHLLAPLIESGHPISEVQLPVLALLISGGHTEFVVMKNWLQYETIGTTVDDAVGEAFDKVARLLGLPYPGGPHISKLAEEARAEGLQSPWKLPRPMLQSGNLQFSFSGLKTAVMYTVRDIEVMNEDTKKLLALEFENAAAEVLVSKTRAALQQTGAQTFLIGGGVAANTHIRRELQKLIEEEFSNIAIHLPDPKITGDNATMIGQTAMIHLLSGDRGHVGDIRADGNLSF